jgi:CRISPR-associated protein Csx17
MLIGVRSDSLLGYLKAIGILRLVAEQADGDATGSWDDATFVLQTRLSREELDAFFLGAYRPTPVFNPWNGGAGFDVKSRTQTAGKVLDAVAATSEARWEPMRRVLGLARDVAGNIAPGDGAKPAILEKLRERYPDDALPWLDAAVVIGREALDFPRLLGTGGNDGRLDFSINFLQRALDVIGPKASRERGELLQDAIDGTSQAALTKDAAIGQYAPANAGGPNASVGFEGGSLVNPWDYIFLIEGVVVFSGSVVKRFNAGARAAFPYTFVSTFGGYGTATAEEATRGEVWLPRWNGTASYRSVVNLIRTARVDVDGSWNPEQPAPRSAISGAEAAQAAIGRGVASGLAGFERIVIAQRNGLAFSATRVGFVQAGITDGTIAAAAVLGREAGRWVNRLRSRELAAGGRQALRAYDEALFDYAARPGLPQLQEWLGALAVLDRRIGLAKLDSIEPFAFRSDDAAWTISAALQTDVTVEHRLAAALASVGFGRRTTWMRRDIAGVGMENGKIAYLRALDMRPLLADRLADAAARRIRVAHDEHERTELNGSVQAAASLEAVAHFLDGTLDERRLEFLLGAYVLLPPIRLVGMEQVTDADIPISWAAMKLLFDGLGQGSGSEVCFSPDVATMLNVRGELNQRQSSRVLERVQRDLRVLVLQSQVYAGIAVRTRDIRNIVIDQPRRSLAALLIPLTMEAREKLRMIVIRPE